MARDIGRAAGRVKTAAQNKEAAEIGSFPNTFYFTPPQSEPQEAASV